MSYSIGRPGYFTEVNGHHVNAEPVSQPLGTWLAPGHPVGIVFHYTAGCSDDIAGTLRANVADPAKGYGGAQFCVGRTGAIFQYAPLNAATWHAYHESLAYWGVEHAAYPGQGCELTDVQLEASAALSAALVEYAKNKWGFSIPLKHWPNARANDYRAGFHDHLDFAGDGQNSHTDHLYRWTWDHYLAAVAAEGDDMGRLDDLYTGHRAYRALVNGGGDPGADVPKGYNGDEAEGWRQAKFAFANPTGTPGTVGPHHHAPADIPHTHDEGPAR